MRRLMVVLSLSIVLIGLLRLLIFGFGPFDPREIAIDALGVLVVTGAIELPGFSKILSACCPVASHSGDRDRFSTSPASQVA